MPVAFDTHARMLATKQDLTALERRMSTEFKRLTWMVGVNIAMNLLILGKLLLFKA